jgi:hypothetical protein
MRIVTVAVFTLAVAALAGCATNPTSTPAQACSNGLSAAYKELDFARAKGFDGTVDYTKAASLLGAAKIQSEFGKYADCIDKVQRARVFIASSMKR